MKTIRKSIIAFLILMVVALTGTAVFPAVQSAAFAESNHVWTSDEVNSLEELREVPASQIANWSQYDSRDYDIVTNVKNQGSTNLCWAYGSIAAMETNILRQGFSGETKDTIDLDEKQLTFAVKGKWDDPLNIADDSYNRKNESDIIWNEMGAISWVTQVVSRGQGVYQEGEMTGNEPIEGYCSYFLRSAISCDNEVDQIKSLIAQYGGVAFTYNSGYVNKTYLYAKGKNDHASFIVGWDDNIDKNMFGDTYGNHPENNGGWIVKNSYGTGEFDNGYCYLSYYSTLWDITAFEMMSAEGYDWIYHYSTKVYNTVDYSYCDVSNADTAEYVAIYKAQKGGEIPERLKAVSVGVAGNNMQITVQLYANVDEAATKYSKNSATFNPKQGELVADATYFASSTGIYTVPINNLPELNEGNYFTVLVKVSGGSVIYDRSGYRSTAMTYLYDNGVWDNLYAAPGMGNSGLLCIKALTVTRTENEGNDDKEVVVDISAGTLNLSGDGYVYTGLPHKPEVVVTLDGMTIPSNSYTVSYENNINAGTATVKVKGRGNYTGNLQTTFVVAKADRSEFNVQLSDWTYGQTANTPSVSNFGLEEGSVDYTYGTSALGPFSEDIPKAAGTYYIRAEMTETDNYESAVAISEFTIRKAASPDLPEEFESLVITGEMKSLSDIELSEGWVWQEPDMLLVAGKMHVTVIYMGEDRSSYEQTVFQIDIDVPEPDNTDPPVEGEEPPVVEPDDHDKKDPDEGDGTEQEEPTEPKDPDDGDNPAEGGEEPPAVEPDAPDDGEEEPPVLDPDESGDGGNSGENNTTDNNGLAYGDDNTVAVIAGVTTGVVGAGAVGGVAFWFVRRRRRL